MSLRSMMVAACAVWLMVGCGDDTVSLDGSVPDASMDWGGRLDARVTPCAADSECDDGTFCSEWRCLPGDPSGDARGCVDRGAPCGPTETCEEATRSCVPVDCSSEPDVDGDGHRSLACGGGDCDDSDPNRNPGVEEICDTAGVDEDCDPTTLGDTDADGDGHVSATCCNGSACGTDCDDTDASVHPAVGESCDGVDNDCSGAIDEETPAAPLCPGGTCSGGRCAFRAFDRAFGSTGFNIANSVDTDAAGDLYITGAYQPGTDFGAGPVDGGFLVRYTADGVLQWVVRYAGTPDFFQGLGVAVDPASGQTYVTASFTDVADIGGESFGRPGPLNLTNVLISVDATGSIDWVRNLPRSTNDGLKNGLMVHGGAVFVASGYAESYAFVGGTRAPDGVTDGYLMKFDSRGVEQASVFLGAPGGRVRFNGISPSPSGGVFLGGDFTVQLDFGSGVVSTIGGAAFVYALDSGLLPLWHAVLDSSDGVSLTDLTATSDGVFATGRIFGGDLAVGGLPAMSTTAFRAAFIASYDLDGRYRWVRLLDTADGGDPAEVGILPHAISVDSSDVIVVGGFNGNADLGGGGISSTFDPVMDVFTRNAFQVRYRQDGIHISDQAFGGLGNQEAFDSVVGAGGSLTIVGGFVGTIDLGSGARTAPPDTSRAFVARIID